MLVIDHQFLLGRFPTGMDEATVPAPHQMLLRQSWDRTAVDLAALRALSGRGGWHAANVWSLSSASSKVKVGPLSAQLRYNVRPKRILELSKRVIPHLSDSTGWCYRPGTFILQCERAGEECRSGTPDGRPKAAWILGPWLRYVCNILRCWTEKKYVECLYAGA